MNPDVELLEMINQNCTKEFVYYDKKWFDRNGNWITTFNAQVRVLKYLQVLSPRRTGPGSFDLYLPNQVNIRLEPFECVKCPTGLSFRFDSMTLGYITPGFLCGSRVEILARGVEDDKHINIEIRNRTSRVIVLPHASRIGQITILSRTGTVGNVDLVLIN